MSARKDIQNRSLSSPDQFFRIFSKFFAPARPSRVDPRSEFNAREESRMLAGELRGIRADGRDFRGRATGGGGGERREGDESKTREYTDPLTFAVVYVLGGRASLRANHGTPVDRVRDARVTNERRFWPVSRGFWKSRATQRSQVSRGREEAETRRDGPSTERHR